VIITILLLFTGFGRNEDIDEERDAGGHVEDEQRPTTSKPTHHQQYYSRPHSRGPDLQNI